MAKLVYVDHVLDLDAHQQVVLGRHRDCDMQIDDRKASRQHCRVERTEDGWQLIDLESANGTLLNGRPVHGKERLRHEDVIAIGASRIQVQLPESAPAPVEHVKRSSATQGVLGNPDTLVGRQLGGFVLTEVRGRTSIGAVFRAKQASLNRSATVTIIAPEALASLQGSGEEVLTLLTQQKIPSVPGLPERFDCGRDSDLGFVWIAAAVLEGEPISEVATRGTVGVVEALLITERIASVLMVVHEAELVYGLLDGEAVILSDDGRVRLRDPGVGAALAKLAEGKPSGDPAYRAPEQAANIATDLYALGCILHLLVTGRLPYRASSADAWIAAHRDNPIPSIAGYHAQAGEKLDQLLQGLLAKNAAWRYHSAKEFLDEAKSVRDILISKPGVQPKTETRKPLKPSTEGSRAPLSVPTPSQSVVERAAERLAQQQRKKWTHVATGVVIIAALACGAYYGIKTLKVDSADGPVTTGSGSGGFFGGSTRKDPPLPSDVRAAALAAGTAPGGTTEVPVVTVPPNAANEAMDEAWTALQELVNQQINAHDYGAAEMATAAYVKTLSPQSTLVVPAQRLAHRVQLAGGQWYQDQIARLPIGSTPNELVEAWHQLSELRDKVLRVDRADATARSDDIHIRLRQHVAGARRDARQAIEAGAYAAVADFGKAVEASFSAAPALTEQRAFIAQCRAVAALGDTQAGVAWPQLRRQAQQLPPADALGVAAALLIAEESAEADRVLRRADLQTPDLVVRREQLFGREAAVLSFDSPGDMRFIETMLAEPSFAGGALVGQSGQASGIRCPVAIGGDRWQARMVIHLTDAAPDQADLLVSCRAGERQDVRIHVTSDGMDMRVRSATGWAEQHAARPKSTPLTLDLTCVDGVLNISVNGTAQFTIKDCTVSRGSILQIDLGGANWRLDDLIVVGG